MTAARPTVCVVGDALLDVDWEGAVDRVCRDAPAPILDAPVETCRPGGAALAAACVAASGACTILVTALSADDNGRHLRRLIGEAGVEVVDLGLDGPTPEKLRLRAGGQTLARVDRGCTPMVPPGPWSRAATAAVRSADAVLVSDYGRGLAAVLPHSELRALLGGRALVWDPHPDGPQPPARTTLATPNLAEAHRLAGGDGPAPPPTAAATVDVADRLAQLLGFPTAVTAGALGAVLADGHTSPAVVPTTPASGDPCGAGDRFAASATVALARGAGLLDAVGAGVADARAFVAGSGRLPRPPAQTGDGVLVRLPVGDGRMDDAADETAAADDPVDDAVAAASAVRRQGGIVVAAGGCFDVLHAGHVRLLDEARRLGDHLVVCLNSDRSVRRLKGPGRPLNAARDRAAVLRSLGSVDGVVVFDDDTPCEVLAMLRPQLFVKGADYEGLDLVEREALAQWGGRVVLLPLVAGHSTTRLISTASTAATASGASTVSAGG